MAKKQDKSQDAQEIPVQTPPPAPQTPPAEPVSNTKIWVFWCVVALAVIAARFLDNIFPGIPESVTERRVMLAFAAFLIAFLYKLK